MIRILALGMIIALAACSSSRQESPTGIGNSPNKLKKSPCACTVLPNAAKQNPYA